MKNLRATITKITAIAVVSAFAFPAFFTVPTKAEFPSGPIEFVIPFGAGGGAGFGGLNSINQVITTYTSPWTYQYCSGGLPQGGNGGTGSTNKVIYDDSSGNLYSYVSGQLTSIFGSTPGTLNGVGTGADIIDGGAGNDHLFGLGGNDIFVFEITDAGASDVDVIWDFNRLGEGDKIRLTNR